MINKRICCKILCTTLVLGSVCGCGAIDSGDSSISDKDLKNLQKIQKNVKEIDDYTNSLFDDLSDLEETYDYFDDNTIDYLEDMAGKLEIIVGYSDEAKSMKFESEDKSINDTYITYLQYLGEVAELYNNVLDVDGFILEVAQIDNERDEVWNSYNDEIDKVENSFKQWQDFLDEYYAVECPGFMRDTYNLYVECFEEAKSLYYEWYYALYLQDPLRINAVTNSLEYTNTKIDNYTYELLDDVRKQYAQSKKLISNRINVYEKELTDNCKKLIECADSDKE